MLYLGRSSREPAVNRTIYVKFKLKFSFLFRSSSAVVVAPKRLQPLSVSAKTLTQAVGSKICMIYLIYLSTKWLYGFIEDIIFRYSYFLLLTFCVWYGYFIPWSDGIKVNVLKVPVLLQHLFLYCISHKTYLLGKCDFAFCSVIVIVIGVKFLYHRFLLVFTVFLLVTLSAEMFMNLWAKAEKMFSGIYHYVQTYPQIVPIGVEQHVALYSQKVLLGSAIENTWPYEMIRKYL